MLAAVASELLELYYAVLRISGIARIPPPAPVCCITHSLYCADTASSAGMYYVLAVLRGYRLQRRYAVLRNRCIARIPPLEAVSALAPQIC
jgi:hypothetical protein